MRISEWRSDVCSSDLPDLDDEARWAAVAARDRNADGRFHYSVRTTGVYCRPSCPARLPRRENVAFHATPADAEKAGFRPCNRCRPAPPVAAAPVRYATATRPSTAERRVGKKVVR